MELSVVGFDDNSYARSIWPSLTTIHQPLEDFGTTAMEIIRSFTGGVKNADSKIDICLNYEFIERNSVAKIEV